MARPRALWRGHGLYDEASGFMARPRDIRTYINRTMHADIYTGNYYGIYFNMEMLRAVGMEATG
jgi:hypothetical protein